MKYKTRIATILIVSIFFFGFFTKPSHAAFEIFGVYIPNSLSEIKTAIQAIYGGDEATPPPEEGPIEIVPENNIEFDENKGPTHETLIFTEDMINEYINGVEGNSMYGFTLEGAAVTLQQNAFEVYVELNNDIALRGKFKFNDAGNDVELVSIENVGENDLPRVHMLALKTMINTASELAIRYAPEEYVSRFSHIEIDPPLVRVWLVAESYVE